MFIDGSPCKAFSCLLFLIVAIVIHPKGFDEIIMDFYQDAGIWIVIASCVAEYLLLITYIAVAAYEFFKNRTLNKRAYSHMNTSFIKYNNNMDIDDNITNSSMKPSITKGGIKGLTALSAKPPSESKMPISPFPPSPTNNSLKITLPTPGNPIPASPIRKKQGLISRMKGLEMGGGKIDH
jgi:hypothetical protein